MSRDRTPTATPTTTPAATPPIANRTRSPRRSKMPFRAGALPRLIATHVAPTREVRR